MEPIDVLSRVDALDDLRRAFREMRWQRKLHEYAVDAVVCIEPVDFSEKILLRCLLRQGNERRKKAERLTGALLVAHIDLRCGILADDDDGEAGRSAQRRAKSQRFLSRFLLNLLGKNPAFKQSCCHDSLPNQTYRLATVKISMAMETMPLRMK